MTFQLASLRGARSASVVEPEATYCGAPAVADEIQDTATSAAFESIFHVAVNVNMPFFRKPELYFMFACMLAYYYSSLNNDATPET
ncbi:MAG: hypothetical protein ABFD89_29500 [Bryobacteraceae bacterium]